MLSPTNNSLQLRKIAMALHVHAQEWLSHRSQNLKENSHHENETQIETNEHLAKNIHSPKKQHNLAAGNGGGDQEQVDMAYVGLVASCVPKPGPHYSP